MVNVDFYTNPREFLKKAGAFLEKDEVEHNLILTLCRTADKKKADIRCGIVTDEDGIVLAAVQTPPHNLVLSKAAHADVGPLVEKLIKNKAKFPGIVGPSDIAGAFSNKWSETTGQKPVEYMDQIIYSLKSVHMPSVDGQLRMAGAADVKLVAQWISEFSKSALPKAEQISDKDAKAQADDLVKNGRMAFWMVKGKPVAQASASGTDKVARINRVYTPPENRGKGYASAVVAQLSKMQLEIGHKKCCLYADARNTQANSIYRKIGYEFAGRSSLYVLGNKAA